MLGVLPLPVSNPIVLVHHPLSHSPKPAQPCGCVWHGNIGRAALYSALLTSSTLKGGLGSYLPGFCVNEPTQPCRYVRQESPLWGALHNGVLTSSTLNGALGLYEPGAVQRLGLPKHYARHGALMAAYSNLLEPEYSPPMQVWRPCLFFSTN